MVSTTALSERQLIEVPQIVSAAREIVGVIRKGLGSSATLQQFTDSVQYLTMSPDGRHYLPYVIEIVREKVGADHPGLKHVAGYFALYTTAPYQRPDAGSVKTLAACVI